MKTSILVILATAVIYSVHAQDSGNNCDLITEIYSLSKKAIELFLTDDKNDQTIYAGCAKAVLLGDYKNCDFEKVRIPQAKVCQNIINNLDPKKLPQDNLRNYKPIIDHAIAFNNWNAAEVCNETAVDGRFVLAKLKILADILYISVAQAIYNSFCQNYPKDSCDHWPEVVILASKSPHAYTNMSPLPPGWLNLG
uniref:Uncharacterized protein n=1 Tax=Strigamia maritima TaxID=126957 RepID=T1JBD1_STRMM